MTKPTETTHSDAAAAEAQDVVSAAETAEPTTPTEPEDEALSPGMKYLTNQGSDPIRLWQVKLPKGVGGTVSGVFLQATNAVVHVTELKSGRFTLFGRMDL